MKKAESALALCREFDAVQTKIVRLTKTIGENLEACASARARAAGPHKNLTSLEEAMYAACGDTHLAQAFAVVKRGDPDECYGSRHAYRSGKPTPEQDAILSACPYCRAAFDAVQDRKAARKRLGIIKRSMRIIGRSEK